MPSVEKRWQITFHDGTGKIITANNILWEKSGARFESKTMTGHITWYAFYPYTSFRSIETYGEQ